MSTTASTTECAEDPAEAPSDAEAPAPAVCPVTEPVPPAADAPVDTAPNAHGKAVSAVARSDAVGGKNCNHGGAVSAAAKKDHGAGADAAKVHGKPDKLAGEGGQARPRQGPQDTVVSAPPRAAPRRTRARTSRPGSCHSRPARSRAQVNDSGPARSSTIEDMPDDLPDPSYRALLEVPQLGRVVASMGLARIGQSMVGVALVLFTLSVYDSPALAGIVTFVSVVPGLLLSPIAGALLDRHGRVRLVTLDYVVAMLSLALIGGLSLAGLLPAPLLVIIVALTSVTSILSVVGLRTLFPVLVPRRLWERINAVDANGYVVAATLGPPLAASLVAFLGAPTAIIVIAVPFGIAAVALIGLREPVAETASTGKLLTDAMDGLRYAWSNPTIRGLGVALSSLNLGWGAMTIVVPIIVLRELGYGDAVVGFVWAAVGVSGIVSASWFGRLDTRGREWSMLVIPMALVAPVIALALPAAGVLGPIAPELGLALLIAMMLGYGVLNGSVDIALFTVRQRRTDPAWMGRAFAVSMAFNYLGFPVGAVIAGILVTVSIPAAIGVGIAASVVAALAAAFLIPAREAAAAPGGA